jgi:hypothetical protein
LGTTILIIYIKKHIKEASVNTQIEQYIWYSNLLQLNVAFTKYFGKVICVANRMCAYHPLHTPLTTTNPKQIAKDLTNGTYLYDNMFAEVTYADITFISCSQQGFQLHNGQKT